MNTITFVLPSVNDLDKHPDWRKVQFVHNSIPEIHYSHIKYPIFAIKKKLLEKYAGKLFYVAYFTSNEYATVRYFINNIPNTIYNFPIKGLYNFFPQYFNFPDDWVFDSLKKPTFDKKPPISPCKHLKTKHFKYTTFEYNYCFDCKNEIP